MEDGVAQGGSFKPPAAEAARFKFEKEKAEKQG